MRYLILIMCFGLASCLEFSLPEFSLPESSLLVCSDYERSRVRECERFIGNLYREMEFHYQELKFLGRFPSDSQERLDSYLLTQSDWELDSIIKGIDDCKLTYRTLKETGKLEFCPMPVYQSRK